MRRRSASAAAMIRRRYALELRDLSGQLGVGSSRAAPWRGGRRGGPAARAPGCPRRRPPPAPSGTSRSASPSVSTCVIPRKLDPVGRRPVPGRRGDPRDGQPEHHGDRGERHDAERELEQQEDQVLPGVRVAQARADPPRPAGVARLPVCTGPRSRRIRGRADQTPLEGPRASAAGTGSRRGSGCR